MSLKSIPIPKRTYYAVSILRCSRIVRPGGDPPVPTNNDLKQLAKLRLQEAEHLHRKKLYDGCVYLCGYVVEFALKARICKILKLHEYPDKGEVGRIFKTHDVAGLKLCAGLREKMTMSKYKPHFDKYSAATAGEREQRYSPMGT